MTIKPFRKWTLALALVAIGAGVAFATVSFDEETGFGFIGRGDVIDHPSLGKGSLVDNPTVTFGASGYYQQRCRNNSQPLGSNNPRYFQIAEEQVEVEIQRETRKAPGSGNITGYLLKGFAENGEEAPEAPARVCPPNTDTWTALTDVEFVPIEGGVLVFDDGTKTGAWEFDEDTQTWVPIP